MKFLRRANLKRWEAKFGDQPRLSAIALIYTREMRDQLRDRRTLFTIAVLPILLYPIVGMLLLQIAQFTRQHPTTICIVGHDHLLGLPPLLDDGETFVDGLIEGDQQIELVSHEWHELAELPGSEAFQNSNTIEKQIARVDDCTMAWVRRGKFDVVVVIPPDFDDLAMASEAQVLVSDAGHAAGAEAPDQASLRLLYNVASDQSMVARERVSGILNRWRGGWVRQRLADSGIQLAVLDPFEVKSVDIAPERTREAAFWSKILPFIMLVWAMTGAFYPAIDLVAGEKERGTLETLLCSPALRGEIVWGKIGRGHDVQHDDGDPERRQHAGNQFVRLSSNRHRPGRWRGDRRTPIGPMLWLFVALVPLSALFSALALAVAAMARSSKEGQYYLMPLMMVTLPLVLLPMLPGTTLSAGTSLIPVTGMFLMVRALVEGQYTHALAHLPIVFIVTAGCLALATRWARRQFESESVLFGGGEQWELRSWIKHLWRDRQTAATPTQGFVCGAVILVALFFGKLAVTSMPTDYAGFAKLILMPQLGMILAPTLLMATVLTTSLRTSLRIRMPHWTTLPIAVLLGLCLHPTYVAIAKWISYMYPISDQAVAAMKPFTDQISSAPWLGVVFLMAFVPAVCEELAFRGFIFGGLLRENGKVRAVLLSALMFGISHGVLQQSIAATCMGLLLGWITLRTGSVLPCILVHFTNNTLSVSMERIATSGNGLGELLFTIGESGPAYHPLWLVISIAMAITCLLYIGTLSAVVDEQEADRVLDGRQISDPGSMLGKPCTGV